MSFFAELKRRNVFRVGAAYLVVAWLLMQVAATVIPALHLPEWIVTTVALFLIIGLPLALIFAWAFELTPEGLKREVEVEPAESITHRTGRKLDFLIIGVLVLALGYFTYDKFVLDPRRDGALVESTTHTFEQRYAEAADAQKSIAVLPFVNISANPEQEYFSDGLAEELLNLLAQIPELRVAARTSSFSFKDEKIDIRTVAEKLNVAHVLEGSVRKSGNTLRITAQLIKADSGFHLWSERFDRQLEDVFAIQEEIAAAVVDALKVRLLGELPKVEEIDPQAYAHYLQGRHFHERHTEQDYAKAVNAYRVALELEPDYAPAWVALAATYMDQADRDYRDLHEGFALARAAVERALALDESLAEAHSMMGLIRLWYDWDWQAADEATQRGLALAPGDAPVLTGAGISAAALGRFDESVALFRRSIERDPLRLVGHHNLALLLTAAGRPEEAAAAFRHLLDLDPQYPGAHSGLGVILLLDGEPQSALAQMEREVDEYLRDQGIVMALSALGRESEADQRLAAFIEEHDEWAAVQIAEIYAWRREADRAFAWLDTAYAQRDGGLAEILGNPLLASLESDPRWPAFLDKVGLPHQAHSAAGESALDRRR